MSILYALINVKIDSEQEVLKELEQIEGVTEAHRAYGPFEIIAKIEADTTDKLKDIVHQVLRVNNVCSSKTAMCY